MKMNKKGQIAPFMVLIMAVLILAIAATILIGEAGFNRLRVANVADGALITATSAFARDLNRIAQIQKGSAGLQVTYARILAVLELHTSLCSCVLPSCLSLGGLPPLEPSMGVPMFPVWENVGMPYIVLLTDMLNINKLYKNAKDIAKDAPEGLRSSLYDASFGGGLIDEPRPFVDTGDKFDYDHLDANGDPTPMYYNADDEVLKDIHGRIVDLNYEAYAGRDSWFIKQYRKYKIDVGIDSWYTKNTLSYSFNKTLELEDTGSSVPGGKQKVKCPGKINHGVPAANCSDNPEEEYESFLQVDLHKVPSNVKVQPLPLILPYVYQIPIPFTCMIPVPFGFAPAPSCFCIIAPGFILIPEGWILGVDINPGTEYGLTVKKKMPFKLAPLLNQESVVLTQTSKVRIEGSIYSGYDFKLEE
ncbi:MAG: hypothetical protein ABIH18_08155 [Candidatus Omnitrophota bacterium]